MAAFSKGETTVILSSLPYQIALYFGGWFATAFIASEIVLYIYKGINLPYPISNMLSESFLLLFFGATEAFRIFLGKKGNLTERPLSVAVSIGLTTPSVVAVLYFLLWQTYILRLELILCCIQLAFQTFQSIFGIFAMLTFARSPQI